MTITAKKFIDLVYKCVESDGLNLYEACIAIKEDYYMEEEIFVEYIKKEKTLKDDLFECCKEIGLVKNKHKKKIIDINELF